MRANLKSISHECRLFVLACVWELTKETIYLPLGCLQGGFRAKRPYKAAMIADMLRHREESGQVHFRACLGFQANVLNTFEVFAAWPELVQLPACWIGFSLLTSVEATRSKDVEDFCSKAWSRIWS